MDHHCPWFNNCICFSTYKFFLLTLFYAVTLCVYGVATLASHMVGLWEDASLLKPHGFHVGFIMVLGPTVAVGLGCLLFLHLAMVFRNETTLEKMLNVTFQEYEDSFDLGNRYRNFAEVFGPRPLLWVIPVFTSAGDGVRFPTLMHPTRDAVDSRASTIAAPYSAATYSTESSSLDNVTVVMDIAQ
ncbi:hypothetical protein HPB50_002660 [Hyalomma asiaticum]|uniref:Uncharacterized protein n=1 Tax=Hyalomma asiaticum TaxID=266040 RepID=A0ACB7S168_HYAAI|nr:hypothetical protein HPB50_002660 [Hyalomma asiaticum]